jgi:sugar lactone lactonase YvrE
MKRVVIGIYLALLIVATADLLTGRAQEAGTVQQQPSNSAPPANPLKVALLKWYKVNLTTTVPMPTNPTGVVFDGANIWMSANGAGQVVKLRASDGAKLGTFAVGLAPMGLAFDGANIWVANSNSSTVSKLRASDGKVLGTFNSGGEMPWYLAFDGQNIWVTNEGNTTLSELKAADGSIVATYHEKHGVTGIAFDGTYMWVSDRYNSVYRYRLDGTHAGTFKVGLQPLNMAFDGANMWVANSGEQSVTKIRASDGKVLGTFDTGNAIGPYGIAFDGQNLWISGEQPYIVEMRPSDGKLLLQQHLVGSLGSVGFDGANIWVAGYTASVAYKL